MFWLLVSNDNRAPRPLVSIEGSNKEWGMGWWNSAWNMLEPETVKSIRAQGVTIKGQMDYYRCGCEESHIDDEKPHLHICSWHEGFDEGVVTANQT